MSINIKMLQSEFGATGDHSPNLELTEKVAYLLRDEFEHDHSGPSNLDSCFFLVQDRVGRDYVGEQACMRLTKFHRGCDENLVSSLVHLMEAEPEIAHLFNEALYRYLNKQ